MTFFARKPKTEAKIPVEAITKLTEKCRDMLAGGAAGGLTDNIADPALKELAEVIGALSKQRDSADITREIAEARKVCAELKKGDLEARINRKGVNAELDELAADINDFTNLVQCFMSEAGATMQAIRDGEFYRRILPEGMGGEFLRHSTAFNALVGQIQDKDEMVKNMTRKFIANVKDMIESSSELSPKATAMSDNAHETKTYCGHAVQSANETRSNVQTVASAAEELSSSIGEITNQVERSSGLITETVGDVDKTSQAISDLSQEVNQISTILNIITEISGQTNLLALNATIEAARAGEAGKGFAVVANEVKSLAQKTAEATDQITSQLQKIQDVTQLATGTVSHIGDKINQVKDIALSINYAMSEQSAATNEISRSAQLAAGSTEEASQRISDVNKGAGDTGQSATEMLETVRIMTENSIVLSRDLDDFLKQVD